MDRKPLRTYTLQRDEPCELCGSNDGASFLCSNCQVTTCLDCDCPCRTAELLKQGGAS